MEAGTVRRHAAHALGTWVGETEQKGDVQNVYGWVGMLGQYSHRAHRAGHTVGRGLGKPPEGTGTGYAGNVLPELLRGLKLNTPILWCSYHHGLRLILC